ncbi:ATP-NAD kinase family protein [Yinghuangia seranimata]|uniref:ATP-NAD kinase family protein n=1 Tax=Yinghuangia seranimata TaxID=408067 RepID=UPI00248ABA90|nr:NAD(+)/NADH kinase [Yinghuangia seranimata]MDI2128471.1 NAD(+)/NADH kinase [Yinghuangia seranimata]
MRVGLVVNPVAGLGGPAGLKGSDGAEVQREARARGAGARAGERAAAALRALRAARPDAVVVTVPGPMGADSAGAECELVPFTPTEPSTADDTRAAVRALAPHVDVLLFAGGDGTARDVLDAAPGRPVLGIPAGVKVYSGCFAVSPAAAGLAAAEFAGETAEAEVVDLDEEAYRAGRVSPRLYGTLAVPAARVRLSGRKTGSSAAAPDSVAAIARDVVAGMRPGVRYVLGPGATTLAIGRELGLPTTLLGVDVVADGLLVGADVSERELLALVDGGEAEAVVSVIGGQGFVLGRGNQQISPHVLRRILTGRQPVEAAPAGAGPGGAPTRPSADGLPVRRPRGGRGGLTVLATRVKLAALGGRPLLADTGDPDVDDLVSGFTHIVTGYAERVPYRIVPASKEFYQ